MTTLIIKSNAGTGADVLIRDMGILIPQAGGNETFTDNANISRCQDSTDLTALCTDDAYGAGSSTLILNDGTSDIPQGDIGDFIAAVTPHAPSHQNSGYDQVALDTDRINMPVVGTPTYDDLADLINTHFSGYLISGGTITDAGSGQINVAAGCAAMKSTDDALGEITFVDFPAATGLALADGQVSWVYVTYNGGSPQVAVSTTPPYTNQTFIPPLGRVFREGSTLHIWSFTPYGTNFSHRVNVRFYETEGTARASGMMISEIGARYLALTSGTYYGAMVRATSAAIDTSGADTFDAWYNDGAWKKVAAQSQIDNAQYNDYGVGLAALTAGYYGVHWIFMHEDGDALALVYDPAEYVSQAAAELATIPSDLPPVCNDFGFLVGKAVVLNGATNLASLLSPFTTVFVGGAAAIHNSLSGLQGGSGSERYHLTSSQGTNATSVAVAGTPSIRKIGTGATDACAGNDSRLSDAAFALTGVISPASIGANQNDYAPAGLAGASRIRLTSSAAYDITGLTGGATGRVFLLHNIGTFTITLKHENASSTAANRFVNPGAVDLRLPANGSCTLVYDGTTTRWRTVGHPTAHSTSHKHGGADEVATATAAANAIPKAGAAGKLDAGWISPGAGNLYDRGFSLINGTSNPYVQVKTAAIYVVMARFVFQGTTGMDNPPNAVKLILSRSTTGITVNVRLYDVTNAQVISEATGLTPSASPLAPSILAGGAVANLPASQAIFEIQLASSSNAAYAQFHYFQLYYA